MLTRDKNTVTSAPTTTATTTTTAAATAAAIVVCVVDPATRVCIWNVKVPTIFAFKYVSLSYQTIN